ncbi:MAG TPA: hypothetical protein VHZ30_02805 [Verrucomicrobiae bacterium]|nr:hypothetical protein [Verrucomicrobiae bacterium]
MKTLSRNDAVGSATVAARKAGLSRIVPSVALAGVPPANSTTIPPTPKGAESDTEKVFGETPKTAVGTTALPKATESFRLGRVSEECNGRGPLEGFYMKSAAVIFVCAGLAVSAFAGDVPSVNQLTETLSSGPWAELPVRVVSVVRHAKAKDRKETTIAAIKAALGLNPAAASAIVGSVARSVPDMAAVAAEAAAGEQNKQAPEIALAAAAANHAAVADIVAGVCHAVPKQYESIAVAASMAAPDSGKEILLAVGKAEPDMKSPIDQVMADYNGYVPSVAFVLDRAKPGGATIAPLANNHTNRPTNPGYTRYNKYPIPVGGFQGQPPQDYATP